MQVMQEMVHEGTWMSLKGTSK